ncbi:MAG: Hsp20/alpha crystallin family protein [Deltaproteobacteria bacterium]|nr:Hsp20/alpha crystallin family protein [Deltaproteobacteria bacterium]
MAISEEALQKLVFLRREIDRIFRDFFHDERSDAIGGASVLADVFEVEGEIIIEVELPGLDKDGVQLAVLRDIVIIEGRKPRQPSDGFVNFHCMERSFGDFRRIVEIPGTGDTRHIRAKLENGILRIRLPKIKDRRGQRRKVPID